jgi:signal transduction histidine kinase
VQNKLHFAVGSTWPYVAALAAALILVASINVLWWRLDARATIQSDLVDHTHQVLTALEETLARADDMVLGQRGYALTHEKDFLKPYFDATNRMPTLLGTLRGLVRDNPKQSANLDRLEPSLANYQKINHDHINELAHGNPLAPDLEFRRKIKDAIEELHNIVGDMTTEENNLLRGRQASSDRATHIVTCVNVVAAVVSMGLIIAVFTALRRENTRRRASELELQRSHEELENRVQQRTLSLVQSEAARKHLEQEILETSDKEMYRIGHDLHDGVGQQLTALSLFTTGLQKEIESQAPQLTDSCKKVGAELREAIRQVRVISHGLSPVSLGENGLPDALKKLADDMRSPETNCQFSDKSETRINDPHLAAQFYRIGQEAVTNAAKHAGARQIGITLKTTPALNELVVTDDGCGFHVPSLNGKAGLGLRAMKYRADLIGATIKIDSILGKGTKITCSLQSKA